MTEEKINRINELARKSKAEGLSEEEKEEQALLRKEYILALRQNLRGQLEHIHIKNPDGSVIHVKERHDKKYKQGEYSNKPQKEEEN